MIRCDSKVGHSILVDEVGVGDQVTQICLLRVYQKFNTKIEIDHNLEYHRIPLNLCVVPDSSLHSQSWRCKKCRKLRISAVDLVSYPRRAACVTDVLEIREEPLHGPGPASIRLERQTHVRCAEKPEEVTRVLLTSAARQPLSEILERRWFQPLQLRDLCGKRRVSRVGSLRRVLRPTYSLAQVSPR